MYKVTREKVSLAIKFLKKDIHDDWYCDLQNYEDIFKKIEKLTEKINTKIKNGRGVYIAQAPVLLNIPKGDCGFRYTLELSPIDRVAFHVFGLDLIELLDKTLPYNILGHRRSLDDETLFKPAIEQWNKFINYTRVCGKSKYIIETDISNYFDNIEISKLKDELIASSTKANLNSDEFLICMYLIESIISILKIISYDGRKGLPQNRDISSFLSNLYMSPLDSCLNEETYFRYMDDIKIIANSRSDANRLMLKISETLRKYGLSLNSSKTKILEPGTEEHTSFINDFDYETKKIDAMLNSGKRKYVNESFKEIFEKTIELIDGNKINERIFRFYANRLKTFLNAKDVRVAKKYKEEIALRLVGAINKRPESADQICALAQAIGPNRKLQENLVDWVIDQNNLTFEWAVYSVIKTLTIQKYRNKKLNKYCLEMINNSDSTDPIKGISAVYLNAKAVSAVKTALSSENSHFLQRHLLIALSSVPPENLRRRRYDKKILFDYVGTHFQLYRMSKSENFSIIKPSDRLQQRVLIKELKNYV